MKTLASIITALGLPYGNAGSGIRRRRAVSRTESLLQEGRHALNWMRFSAGGSQGQLRLVLVKKS